MRYQKVLASAATATAVIASSVDPTLAHSSAKGNVFWDFALFKVGNNPSGCGGETQSGTVRGIQTLLWASGGYGAPSGGNKNQIDGIYGPSTRDAISGFEWRHGINPWDGCATSATYAAMRSHFVAFGQFPGQTVPVERYKYRDDSVPFWFPGTTPPQIRIVKENYGGGCFWYDFLGWQTYSHGSLDSSWCWFAPIDESTGNHDHLGFPPHFSTSLQW